jgi:hypothetical protein
MAAGLKQHVVPGNSKVFVIAGAKLARDRTAGSELGEAAGTRREDLYWIGKLGRQVNIKGLFFN